MTNYNFHKSQYESRGIKCSPIIHDEIIIPDISVTLEDDTDNILDIIIVKIKKLICELTRAFNIYSKWYDMVIVFFENIPILISYFSFRKRYNNRIIPEYNPP